MRNGLLLAVGALTLALLPAVSHASAPIFTDVPGVIVLNVDNGTTMSANSVFTYDTAVYDPDTDNADLAWSFIETAEGLGTVTDVDGAGPGNIFITAEGVGAVADAAAARALTAASAENIAGAATDFSLVINKATSGTAASAVAMAAGTNNAMTANDDLFTTIMIAVTDGVNATYKTVLVKSNYGTPYTNNSDGLYEVIPGSTFANTVVNTNLVFTDQWANGIVTNGNAANSCQINTAGAGLTYNAATQGYSGPWGFGYWWTVPGTNDFTVEKGYVYRLRAKVTAINATAANTVGNIRMRMQAYPVAGLVGEFNLQPQDGGTYTDILNLFAAPSKSWDLEALLQPPQETRLDGKAYNTKYQYYLEYTPFFSTHTAGVNFSNIVLDRFAIPQANSNGLIYYADTTEQWTTFTNANGTTETAPFGYGDPSATDPTRTSKGWKLVPRGLTSFLVSANEFASPYIEHTAFATSRGYAATTVTDTITTIRTGTAATEGSVQVLSLNQSNTSYKGALDELILGQEWLGGTTGANSIVPSTLLTSLKGDVYYRCSMSAKMVSGNPIGKNPQIVLRVGTPNAGWGGNLEINEASGSGPSPSEWTNYVTWVRGMPAYAAVPQENMTIKVQVADTNALQGLGGLPGDNAIGGTVCIDTMSLEMFPAAFWD